LVGFGQWDLAYKTPPRVFATKMKKMLEMVKDHPMVFGRSMHYNPLGDDKMTCPPKDDRSPPFVDIINASNKRIFSGMGREWIDTKWIDGAMWDSAPDWNHLPIDVEIVQALFLAQTLKIGIFSPESSQADTFTQ